TLVTLPEATGQKCSTPGGIGAGSTCAIAAAPTKRRCSTPGGIGAGSTADPPAHRAGPTVLNARRHRSGIDEDFRGRRVEVIECSTPAGIGAGSTGLAERWGARLQVCSTP